ncbi:hypothetical protein K504DRAFT_467690 [Pleomassaria siparia CBS 279.74]|uniref:Uncharacterized protein n=1 Tax=Pleomassaria siparia CBS 279.74 TaxID=1314801 RepID=A0A6G1KBC6_9PLEO|nr:hypothetical protein K504DRAFT_467690 [Pleomassaria siparia CBS 279.74]
MELHEGAYNTCWTATARQSETKSGKMYEPVGVRLPKMGYTEDEQLATKVWEWTQKELEAFK